MTTIRGNIQTLMRSTVAYSISTLVGPLFAIVLTPIYTRVLTQSDFGALGLVETLGMIVSVIGTLGMRAAMAVYLHDQPDERGQLRLAATGIWLGAGFSALLAVAAVVAAQPLAQLWVGKASYAPAVAIYLASLPFGAIYTLQVEALRLRQQAWRAAVLGISYVVLSAALNLLLVVLLRYGVVGAVSAEALTYTMLTLVGLVLAPRTLISRPRPDLVRPLLLAGLPLVPMGLATWALGYIDRPLLVHMGIGLDQLGVYDIGNKLASMLTLAGLPFQSAWLPFALSIQHQPEARRVYARTLTYYVAAMLGAALALGIFAHEALLVFTTYLYLGAQQYVWILAYVAILNGCYGIIMVGLYLTRKTSHLAWTTTFGAAMNVALNMLLIPRLGVLGAAIATPLGYLCGPVAAYFVVQRVYPVPYELRKLLAALLVELALLAVGLPLSSRTSLITLVLRGLILLAYPVLLVALGVIHRSDIAVAIGWVRRRALAVVRP